METSLVYANGAVALTNSILVAKKFEIMAEAVNRVINNELTGDSLNVFLNTVDSLLVDNNDSSFRTLAWTTKQAILSLFYTRCKSEYNTDGSVTYLMRDKSTGLVKIGRSKSPYIRERTLQSQKPTIEIMMICDSNIERELHRKYKSKRIRGEWFNLTESDIKNIVKEYGFRSVKKTVG